MTKLQVLKVLTITFVAMLLGGSWTSALAQQTREDDNWSSALGGEVWKN